METLHLVAGTDADAQAWARWLTDVMTSWPAQLAILLLWTGLCVLLALHARREWENGLRNKYLVAGLSAAAVFFVLQFLLAGSLVGGVSWPVWPFVVETIMLVALWLYAFARFMTRQRSGAGDDKSRERGAALDDFIEHGGGPA
jgi:hypothetical protein